MKKITRPRSVGLAKAMIQLITINYVVYQLDMELMCTQLYRQLVFLNYADLESQLCTTSLLQQHIMKY